MDWKKQLARTVNEQPVNEGFFNDTKNFIFGKSRGEKEEDIRSNMMKSALGGVHPASPAAPTAPPPDPFAEIKAHTVPEGYDTVVNHVRDTLMMARHADAKAGGSHDTGLPNYNYDSINDRYSVGRDHSAYKLAQHTGAAILSAHTGLPERSTDEDHYLHHVELDDDNNVVAHYHSAYGKYGKTTFKKTIG